MINSTAELFNQGNYATTALKGAENEWQTYAALGLVGNTQAALEGLSQFNNEEAYFYSAVASWIGGDEDKATYILETIPTPHAQNLLALISKSHIQVLAQLPWTRAGSWDLLTAAAKDSKFQVANISFHPEDIPNQPYADIHQFYNPDHPPDFYICQMVEWHLIPPNLQELPCPILGQTADYDLHIQIAYPWLQLFDEILVTDQSEWQDVRRLVKVPVSTFPKSFCLTENLPPLPNKSREFDLFLSGTVTHPYHPDKAQLLHQILGIPDLRLKIVNGFGSEIDYYNNLANAKVGYTYIRHPSALPTRGLEALGMGSALVVQEDSVLTIFAGEEQGVLTYELEKDNLAIQIQKIVEQWPEFEQRAKRGAEIIRQEFAAPKVASQYLRFLTFLAAKSSPIPNPQSPIQKRPILQKGWLPSYDFLHSPILKQMGIANYNQLKVKIALEQPSSHHYIDLARESVLYNYHLAEHQLIPVEEWLSSLIDIYQKGISKFPQSLVLRFNFIRVMLHFGQPEQVSEALQLVQETLALPISHWQLDVMEDVFPWDFCPYYFNYRKYFDLVTEQLTQGNKIEVNLSELILASLHYYQGFYSNHYQGFYSQSLDHFKQAAILDPDFPYYKFHYAKQLIERGLSEDYTEAGEILLELAQQSILFVEAFDLLAKLQAKRQFISPQFPKLASIIKSTQGKIRLKENLPEVALKAAKSSTKSELERAGNQVKKSFFNLEVIKYKLRSFFDVTNLDLHTYTPRNNVSPEELMGRIRAMESSKFWQLRTYWFRLKFIVGKALRKIKNRLF